jgi:hypothetical protein
MAGRPLRGRAEISSHSGASAGWADARRRDAGDAGHRRGAATLQMPVRRRAPQGGAPYFKILAVPHYYGSLQSGRFLKRWIAKFITGTLN